MPRFGPIKRRELVSCLRRLGFTGPFAGGKHESCSGAIFPSPSRIRMLVTLARTYWRNCSDKVESDERSGRSFEPRRGQRGLDQAWRQGEKLAAEVRWWAE